MVHDMVVGDYLGPRHYRSLYKMLSTLVVNQVRRLYTYIRLLPLE